MIRRHNLKQLLFVPLHLAIGVMGYLLCWWLFTAVIGSVFKRFEPHLPASLMEKREIVTNGIALLAIFAATLEGWKLWSQGITDLPGIFNVVSPPSQWGVGAGSARFEMTTVAVEYRVILNLALSGPLQVLAAWQRLRALIPDTEENRATIQRWRQVAEAQRGWHSETVYAEDGSALEWLCRMGFLDYSPTRRLVIVRKE